jgi:hypothetical protein
VLLALVSELNLMRNLLIGGGLVYCAASRYRTLD